MPCFRILRLMFHSFLVYPSNLYYYFSCFVTCGSCLSAGLICHSKMSPPIIFLKSFPVLLFLFLSFTSSVLATFTVSSHGKSSIKPGNNDPRPICVVRTQVNSTDDAPVVLNAFKKCGKGGNIVFLNQTYHINTVMNTTGLKDCEVHLYGTMLVSLSLLFRYLSLTSLSVGHQYHLLAEQFSPNWLPKPILSLVLRWR